MRYARFAKDNGRGGDFYEIPESMIIPVSEDGKIQGVFSDGWRLDYVVVGDSRFQIDELDARSRSELIMCLTVSGAWIEDNACLKQKSGRGKAYVKALEAELAEYRRAAAAFDAVGQAKDGKAAA